MAGIGRVRYREPQYETPEKSPQLREAQLRRLLNLWDKYLNDSTRSMTLPDANNFILSYKHIIFPLREELNKIELDKAKNFGSLLSGQQSNTGLDTVTFTSRRQ